MTEQLCSRFDHTDPNLSVDLAGNYATMRNHCPVTKSEAHGGFWAISRYQDIIAAAQNHRVLQSGGGVTIPALGNPLPALPTESDEPEHTAYRAVIWDFLTPGAVKRYEAGVRAMVNDLLDDIIEAGAADLVPALAEPLPIRAAGLALGFNAEEGDRFYRDFRTMVEAAGAGDMNAAIAAAGSFIAFLGETLAAVAKEPRENSVITAVVNGKHADGRPFSGEEQIGTLFATSAAAVETTTHAVAHLLHRVAEPGLKRQLMDEPGLIHSCIEEMLRIDSPNNMLARTVAEPLEFGGQQMQTGDRVLLLWGSGNLDETAFPDPDKFIPDRSPNQHLAFGWGIHKCAGQHFARLELRVALQEVLRRIPDYEIAGEVPPPHLKGGLFWTLDALPVRFTPGARETSPA
jgi:cytochrome P450